MAPVALPVTLPVTGVRLSLWRAVTLFRVVTLAACLYLIVRWQHLYARPDIALLAGAAMLATTAWVSWLALRGRAHRRAVVLADVAVTAVLTLLSAPAQTAAQHHGGMPTLTTVWAAGPALEAGIVTGWAGGMAAGALQLLAAIAVRGGYDGRTLSSGLILLVAGAATGYVATLVVRSERELAAATAARAAQAERERLARSIHDGALQVLGLVHRRGRDAGGEWTAIAAAAAEQEAALRSLITSSPSPADGARLDVTAALRELRDQRVSVAAPAEPIHTDAADGREITAAVAAALQNVRRHAGPGARAWVLVERVDDTLLVTVRDDGVGIPAHRLDEARREGRFGVAASIIGRMADLGGSATVSSTPGHGTVVELSAPLRGAP